MLGAWRSASRPTCLRRLRVVSPLLAASRSFEATCARTPLSLQETLSQTSSRSARRSAVVAASNIGDFPTIEENDSTRASLCLPLTSSSPRVVPPRGSLAPLRWCLGSRHRSFAMRQTRRSHMCQRFCVHAQIPRSNGIFRPISALPLCEGCDVLE